MPHITFIHGIANKPAPDKLLRTWRQALAREGGLDLGAKGVSATMVYWADVLYEKPLDDEPAYESAELSESQDLAITATDPKLDLAWKATLPTYEQAWVNDLETKLQLTALVDEMATPPEAGSGPEFERIPLPGFLKRELMKIFLRDTHHYLFNATFSPRPGTSYRVQEELRQRMVTALQVGASKPGPHVIVSHSMGTVIAYDCLKRVQECPRVDGLMTIGSPLGLDEIQDALKPEWTRQEGFPSEKTGDRWINIYDRLDPVAGLDPVLANYYRKNGAEVITDLYEPNWGRWRHDITKYLKGAELRAKLAGLIGL